MSYIADYNYIHGNIYEIKCSDLQSNSNQPRKYFCPEAMENLGESISSYGLIHPITFTQKPTHLELVSGERRWRAFQNAGIECIQAKYVDRDLEAIALAENFQREELNPLEKAEIIFVLKTQHNFTLAQISEYIGKSVSSVSELLSLNRLPEEIKVVCRNSNKYVLTRLVQIAKTPGLKSKRQLFKTYQLELSGDNFRGELRRDRLKINNQIAKVKGVSAYLLSVNINDMAKYDGCDLMSLVDELHRITHKMSNEYRALSVSVCRNSEVTTMEK